MTEEDRTQFGWEKWTWDESLFAGAAPYYRRGREPYSPGLAEAVLTALPLDGHGRLLDVGCGPGTVAMSLARLFDEVVGIDPDPGMLEEARRLAGDLDVRTAHWLCLRGEDLPAGLGQFRVITFAQSFHWMDRLQVARAVHPMLVAGGAVIQVDPPRPGTADAGGSFPYPLQGAIDDLRRRWLGPHRRAGQSLRDTSPGDEDAVFQRAGFRPAQEVVVPDGRVLERSADEVIANCLSMSSMAPHLFGDRLGEFVDDLRSVLLETSPTGRFTIRLSDNRLRLWRPR